jgi:dsRNA-specific ribonuclease
MKITKSQLKQIIKEELESVLAEQEEQKYRLIIVPGFCMGGQCVAHMKVIHLETSKITAIAEGQGKTKEEALQAAKVNLIKKLQAKGLDLNKIQVLKK